MPSPSRVLSLAERCDAAAEAVRIVLRKIDTLTNSDLPRALVELAELEAQVLDHAPGWEDAVLSGLVEGFVERYPQLAPFAARYQNAPPANWDDSVLDRPLEDAPAVDESAMRRRRRRPT